MPPGTRPNVPTVPPFPPQVCRALGDIPLHVVPLTAEYWALVVEECIAGVRRGRTPNPDMLCNSRVKFGAFHAWLARQEPAFDRIASGHYARVERGGAGGTGEATPHLATSPDAVKDQTYFLSRLSGEQLARCMFPLGHLQKTQVCECVCVFVVGSARDRSSEWRLDAAAAALSVRMHLRVRARASLKLRWSLFCDAHPPHPAAPAPVSGPSHSATLPPMHTRCASWRQSYSCRTRRDASPRASASWATSGSTSSSASIWATGPGPSWRRKATRCWATIAAFGSTPWVSGKACHCMADPGELRCVGMRGVC